MKSILLIGLGRFGRHIAEKLNELNHQVLAVDKQEDRVEAVLPFVTSGQIGDSTNIEFLQSLGIGNFDVCIVAIGGDFQSSLETNGLFKGSGCKAGSFKGRKGMFRQDFCCAMAQMRSCIRRNSWQTGQRSVIARSIFLIISSYLMTMRSLRSAFRKTGWERLLEILTSERNTTSLSWL